MNVGALWRCPLRTKAKQRFFKNLLQHTSELRVIQQNLLQSLLQGLLQSLLQGLSQLVTILDNFSGVYHNLSQSIAFF